MVIMLVSLIGADDERQRIPSAMDQSVMVYLMVKFRLSD
jgi:hypothetical protein